MLPYYNTHAIIQCMAINTINLYFKIILLKVGNPIRKAEK